MPQIAQSLAHAARIFAGDEDLHAATLAALASTRSRCHPCGAGQYPVPLPCRFGVAGRAARRFGFAAVACEYDPQRRLRQRDVDRARLSVASKGKLGYGD